MRFESLGQYHDYWAYVIAYAPDNFPNDNSEPIDQVQALRKAFDQLRSGFGFASQKLRDERLARIVQELLEMSYEAYATGDKWNGAHTLNECEGMIWTGRKQKVKYAVEAERRAFGTNILYAGVRVSPYPCRGASGDMGGDQAMLLEMAMRECRTYQRHAQPQAFDYLAWVVGIDGIVSRISPNPARDNDSVLRPLQKTQRATERRQKELAALDQIRASVLVFLMNGSSGVVSYDLEQKGHPRVSARQSFKIESDGNWIYNDMNYYLEDPVVFPASTINSP